MPPQKYPIVTGPTFQNPDREYAQLYIREHVCELLDAPKKNYDAIKLIYGLILKEEEQDLTRRRVEVCERDSAHEIEQDEKSKSAKESKNAKPKILTAGEIKHRMRVLLGKESPQ